MKLFLTNSLFRPLTFAVNGKLKKASVASMFASAGKKKEESDGKKKEESVKKVKEESVKAEPKDDQEEQKENAKPEPKETTNGSKVGNN